MSKTDDEFPRRKRRGINRKILIAPRGGELNPRPPEWDSSAGGGLKTNLFSANVINMFRLDSVYLKRLDGIDLDHYI